MKNRRILYALLCGLMLLSLFSFSPARAADPPALEGSGAPGDPYLIGSANELIAFAQAVNAGQTDACGKLVRVLQASAVHI